MPLNNHCLELKRARVAPESGAPGLSAGNFRKIAVNGFNDPYNAYPHSMTWFKDHLYVGTTRANLANRGVQIRSKTPEKLGEVWPVQIPPTGFENDLRAQIWRYAPAADVWTKVFTAPMAKGIEGFEVPLSIGFRAIVSFQGASDPAPALYVPTWGTYQTPTTYMIRSADGVHFEIVSEPGLCTPESKPWGLRGLVAFKNRLFTSPAAGRRHECNLAGLMAIMVNDDPRRGDWRLACEPQFGDPNNLSVFHMAVFNGCLYAGTLNINEGFQIWKTDAEGEPPYRWNKVLSRGAFRGKLNQMAMTLVPFKGHLYVGSGIQNGGFDFDNNIGPAAPEVIRINADDTWDLIVGEPRKTPEGLKVPLSGLEPGFGNPFAGYLWSMCAHEGWLYAGTAVWAVFLRFAGGRERLPKSLRTFLNPDTIEKMLLNFGGCDLWRTRDGLRWQPVTQNGFDNCFNLGIRNMVSTPYGLFVGTANPFAPEVAVHRAAGWTYEDNPKGGLEIWLGSHEYHGAAEGEAEAEASKAALYVIESGSKGKKKYEEQLLEGMVREFYGKSAYRHVGFWHVGVRDLQSACDTLMAEVMAFIPEKKGTIVDLDCGYGETTRYLLRHYQPEAVVGLTADKHSLAACRETAPPITFSVMKRRGAPAPERDFECALWVKGLSGSISRRKVFKKGFRLLKPGGQLVCFDMLPVNGRKRKGAARVLDTYAAAVAGFGFQNIRIIEVTPQTVGEYRKYVDRYSTSKLWAEEIDESLYMRVKELLMPYHETECRGVLVSCVKPNG